ncbi:MAG: biotin transporter BioY [bacterium]
MKTLRYFNAIISSFSRFFSSGLESKGRAGALTRIIFASLVLSWVFALCAQFRVFLPFNLVPIYILPMIIFLSVFMLGWTGVYSVILYIIQGVLGAPFFSGGDSGLIVLVGPRGGYIFGYTIAAAFLALVRNYKKETFIINLFKIWIAHCIMFLFGLVQLAFFVPVNSLLIMGLYPFIIGDFVLKTGFILVLLKNSVLQKYRTK